MSDSQRFPVAAHALAYLAHKGAVSSQAAISSAELAGSISTNPVVVRRTTTLLAKAGLIGTRTGAGGGAWLKRPADSITLDQVLQAVNGCAHLGAPPPGAPGCPVGMRIPKAVQKALDQVEGAARECLSRTTVADLLKDDGAAAP
jgi:DNA-binding IscR family transcriptional regulator